MAATKVHAYKDDEKIAAVCRTRTGQYYQYWPRDAAATFDTLEDWKAALESAVTFTVMGTRPIPPAVEHPHVAYVRRLYDIHDIRDSLQIANPNAKRVFRSYRLFAEDETGTLRAVLFNRVTGAMGWATDRAELTVDLIPHFDPMPVNWYTQSTSDSYFRVARYQRAFAYEAPAGTTDLYLYCRGWAAYNIADTAFYKTVTAELTAAGYRVIGVPNTEWEPEPGSAHLSVVRVKNEEDDTETLHVQARDGSLHDTTAAALA